jgi:hypothetical protein
LGLAFVTNAVLYWLLPLCGVHPPRWVLWADAAFFTFLLLVQLLAGRQDSTTNKPPPSPS